LTLRPGHRLSSRDRARKHCGCDADANDHQQALTGRQWPASRRPVSRRRRVGRRPPQAALEPGHGKILIEVDGSREDAYLGAPVEPARHRRQVVVLERLEMAPWNLRFVGDLLERDASAFAGVPQEVAERGAVLVVGALRRSWSAGNVRENRGHWRWLTWAPCRRDHASYRYNDESR
jgi:hypothetical protein